MGTTVDAGSGAEENTGTGAGIGAGIGSLLALTGLLDESNNNNPTGYQGGIPKYTFNREAVQYPHDPNRRPGSFGRQYFSDSVYSAPPGTDPATLANLPPEVNLPSYEQAQTFVKDQAQQLSTSQNPWNIPSSPYSTMGLTSLVPSAEEARKKKLAETTSGLEAIIAAMEGGSSSPAPTPAPTPAPAPAPSQSGGLGGMFYQDSNGASVTPPSISGSSLPPGWSYQGDGYWTHEDGYYSFSPVGQGWETSNQVYGNEKGSPWGTKPNTGSTPAASQPVAPARAWNDYFGGNTPASWSEMSNAERFAHSKLFGTDWHKEAETKLSGAEIDSGNDLYREIARQSGIAGLASGGYLAGATDGMADMIPARIGGIADGQEAALSHGEFVVPADVVSYLGNGNSDAGAAQLEAMMNRIRQQKTGSTEQAKPINPESVMPR